MWFILYNLIKQVYMSLNEDPSYNYVEQVPIPSTGFAIKVNDEIIDLNEYFLPNDPSSNTFTSDLSKNEDFITTDDTNLTSYFCKSLASSSTFESNYVIANADIARKLEPFHYRVVGMIKIWSGTTLPAHHLLCDGSGVNIHEYPKLFTMIYKDLHDNAEPFDENGDIINNTSFNDARNKYRDPLVYSKVLSYPFQNDDGQDVQFKNSNDIREYGKFYLPNLVNRNVMMKDVSGVYGGNNEVALTENNLPIHEHIVEIDDVSFQHIHDVELNYRFYFPSSQIGNRSPNSVFSVVGNTYINTVTSGNPTINAATVTTNSSGGHNDPTPLNILNPTVYMNYIICYE
jgi:microcystin-dependent protein